VRVALWQQHLPIENDFPQGIGIDAGQAHFPPDAHVDADIYPYIT